MEITQHIFLRLMFPFTGLEYPQNIDERNLRQNTTAFWDVASCSLVEVYRPVIALMMETSSTSETSVNFYQSIRRNNPQDSHLHTRRRENLKPHKFKIIHMLTDIQTYQRNRKQTSGREKTRKFTLRDRNRPCSPPPSPKMVPNLHGRVGVVATLTDFYSRSTHFEPPLVHRLSWRSCQFTSVPPVECQHSISK
jgi:hypothetical protein